MKRAREEVENSRNLENCELSALTCCKHNRALSLSSGGGDAQNPCASCFTAETYDDQQKPAELGMYYSLHGRPLDKILQLVPIVLGHDEGGPAPAPIPAENIKMGGGMGRGQGAGAMSLRYTELPIWGLRREQSGSSLFSSACAHAIYLGEKTMSTSSRVKMHL